MSFNVNPPEVTDAPDWTETNLAASARATKSALDGKSAMGHVHTVSQVTGLQTDLDAKSAIGHTHTIADVSTLQASLDGKSATGHTHIIANTDGLQAALDANDTAIITHVSSATAHGRSAFMATLADDVDAPTARQTLGLGTAATKDVGTGPNNVIQADSLGRLPAINASQLLNLPASGETIVKAFNMTDATIAGTNGVFTVYVQVTLTVGVWDIVPYFQHNNLLGTNVSLRVENTISGGADFSGLNLGTAGVTFNGTNTVVGNSVLTKGIIDSTISSFSVHSRASTGQHAFGGLLLVEVTRAGLVSLSYSVTGTAAASITINGGAIVCRRL